MAKTKAKAKKLKIPPMSEARKAIFAEFQIEPAEAASLHEQLTRNYSKLLEAYKELTFTDDPEANGNLLLTYAFKRRVEREAVAAARYRLGRKLASEFKRMFGVDLCRYYDFRIGFDICKFDTDVVKAPDGESCRDAIRRQWGEAGLKLMVRLMFSSREELANA